MKIKSILVASILVLIAAGCSAQGTVPEVAPLPTYTPYPTYTPFPPAPVSEYAFVLVWGADLTGFDAPDDLACQQELGADSRLADWVDLALYQHDGGSLAELSAALGASPDDYMWISLASQVDYSDSDFYAVMAAPTRQVYFDGLDALPDWSEPVLVLTHRSGDPMLPWLPALCILEEQPSKQP